MRDAVLLERRLVDKTLSAAVYLADVRSFMIWDMSGLMCYQTALPREAFPTLRAAKGLRGTTAHPSFGKLPKFSQNLNRIVESF